MKHPTNHHVFVTVASAAVLSWLACSGLVEDSGNDTGGGSVGVSAGGATGTGGATDTGGVGLEGFTGTTPPASLNCTTTDGLEGEMVDTFPCPDRPQCEALDQPGEYDQDKYEPTCPDEPTVYCGSTGEVKSNWKFSGCCRSDGYCGLFDGYGDYFDSWFGCFSRDPWIENAALLGEEKVPIRCTPK
jgi:hypothetical protein